MPTADQLRDAAEQLSAMNVFLGARSTSLADGIGEVGSVAGGIPQWWTGPRAVRVGAQLAEVAAAVTPAAAALASIAGTAQQMSRRAGELGTQAAMLESELSELQRSLWYRPLVPTVPVVAPLPDPRVERLGEIERLLDGIDEQWLRESVLAARSIDAVLASCRPATRVDIDTRRLGLGGDPVLLRLVIGLTPGLHTPSPDRRPEAVDRWWRSLDENQRRALVATMPGVIGNLDGVPLPDRAVSIRTYLDGLLDAEGPNGPMRTRLDQFIGPDGRIDPHRKLIAFDGAGDGRVAEYVGDFDDADHVSVVVPGMGSTLANFSSGVSRDAEKLWRESGPGTAVIAWTGYDAPAGTEEGLRAIEVASPRQAEEGGRALHSFLDGLHTQTSASLTVIGHSYGSLTVGKALSDGARVTNVVFIGSPGVGVDHVRDFPPGAADHVYAGEVKGDPVATLQHFGDDPTDPDFGAYVFDAGRGDSADPLSRHSEYFDDGAAIDNLVAISTGGTPTAGHMTFTEHVLEAGEDVTDGVHTVVDVGQAVHHVPFFDDEVDAAIDTAQGVADDVRDTGAAVVETGGHLVDDAVGWLEDNHIVNPFGIG